MELLCGFAPNFTVFLVLRILFGIGMGGEWGLGASLAMESAPQKKRGLISGILQSGYSSGYLLAAIATRTILPSLGWRAMFGPADSPRYWLFTSTGKSRKRKRGRRTSRPASRPFSPQPYPHGNCFLYLAALMTLMHGLSHGTQDLYPDFLKSIHSFTTRARLLHCDVL